MMRLRQGSSKVLRPGNERRKSHSRSTTHLGHYVGSVSNVADQPRVPESMCSSSEECNSPGPTIDDESYTESYEEESEAHEAGAVSDEYDLQLYYAIVCDGEVTASTLRVGHSSYGVDIFQKGFESWVYQESGRLGIQKYDILRTETIATTERHPTYHEGSASREAVRRALNVLDRWHAGHEPNLCLGIRMFVSTPAQRAVPSTVADGSTQTPTLQSHLLSPNMTPCQRRKVREQVLGMKEDSRVTGQFRKRNSGLTKKAHELAILCKAQVYLVVQRRGQFYVYTSHEHRGWPPSQEQIDQSYPLPRKVTAESPELLPPRTLPRGRFASRSKSKSSGLRTASVLLDYHGVNFEDFTKID